MLIPLSFLFTVGLKLTQINLKLIYKNPRFKKKITPNAYCFYI